jgi:hypothetical protein
VSDVTSISVQTRIEAPAEAVWAVLTDFASYPQWNPFIRQFNGNLALGAKVEVVLQPDGSRRSTYRPTIVELERGSSFAWLGHTIVRGVFDGRHRFELRSDGKATVLKQSESFEGVLVPLLKGTLAGAERGFRKMNEVVKRRAEAGARVS